MGKAGKDAKAPKAKGAKGKQAGGSGGAEPAAAKSKPVKVRQRLLGSASCQKL